VAAAAVAAPAIAKAAIATPKPAGWVSNPHFLPGWISTPRDITLPTAVPGWILPVHNSGDQPIYVHHPRHEFIAVIEMRPGEVKEFVSLKRGDWHLMR
jgi:hypothetical protein